ncbi:RNA polymerase I-specific transcription initiation factor RRN3 [Amylostereum chailletii]|nr:RNA polymerase I-specific transcription initiation factor RRN3 [Amylostereum chailletii]
MASVGKTASSLDGFAKKAGMATPGGGRKKSGASITMGMGVGGMRPIATNSRIKQEERLRNDMYLSFVSNALLQKSMGNQDAFDELVDQFTLKRGGADAQSPVPQLRLWIQALTHVVSRLDRTHTPLVDAIVRMPWMTLDSSFVKTYTSFVGILVSAKPEYLSMVLARIAQGFTYQSGLQALDAGLPESSSTPLTRRIVYDRIHVLLQQIISLIPTLPSTLHPLLARNFPHKRQNKAAQITYIRNMLRISDYCPEIADRILATIIDRAIQIDVEIQVELEELEAAEETEDSPLFELDPFDTLVGQEGDPASDNEDDGDDFSDLSSEGDEVDDDDVTPAATPIDVDHITDMVGKLDSILKLVFDHFNATLQDPAPGPPDPDLHVLTPEGLHSLMHTQFHTLLAIFERTILRTFKSRYTQFLVFWFASLDSEFSDTFTGELIGKALMDDHHPVVTRAAAASYLASFVSRATFVDRESTRSVVKIVCNFLRSQLDVFEGVGLVYDTKPAPSSVVYAVTQAMFLMFCFRWRDLQEDTDADEFDMATGGGRKWMTELNVMQRIVTSALNPLLVCSDNVVQQFARVAQATGFIYVYPILEANKRHEFVPTTSAAFAPSKAFGTAVFGDKVLGELNTFFPFDPYKLPKSASYVEKVYREWSSVAIEVDDDEEEEEEEEEMGGDVIGMMIRAPTEEAADGLGESFGGMSISPAPTRPGV